MPAFKQMGSLSAANWVFILSGFTFTSLKFIAPFILKLGKYQKEWQYQAVTHRTRINNHQYICEAIHILCF